VLAPRQKLAEEFGDRIKGRALEEGAAARFDPVVRFRHNLLMEALHQAASVRV